MLNKMRKILKGEKGFTLIELITVIVILGVILGIGLPRYAKMQAQSEWDSDVATLKNLEKAAEVYYASKVSASATVKLSDVSGEGLFDSNVVLKRKAETAGTGTSDSIRNSTKAALPDTTTIAINEDTGTVTHADTAPADGVNDWINNLIGTRPK